MDTVKAKIELTPTLNAVIDDIAKSYRIDKWAAINALLIYGYEAVRKEEPRIDELLRKMKV